MIPSSVWLILAAATGILLGKWLSVRYLKRRMAGDDTDLVILYKQNRKRLYVCSYAFLSFVALGLVFELTLNYDIFSFGLGNGLRVCRIIPILFFPFAIFYGNNYKTLERKIIK
jgi:hypothetical protein